MWNPEEIKFITEHPEVFEEATSPERLRNRIESFVNYHWLRPRALVLAWAELKGQYSLGLSFKSGDEKILATLYLTQGLNKYSILYFYVLPKLSPDGLIRVTKDRLEEIGISPVEKMIPSLWEELKRVIMK